MGSSLYAAKKKLSERNQSRDEFTTSNLNSTYNNNPTSKNTKERKGQPEGLDLIAEEDPMNVEETEKPSFGSYYADGDDVIEYVNVAKSKLVTENDIKPAENEVPKNVEAIGLLRYVVAFDRIRKYVIDGGGQLFLFAYVLVNVVWTVQAAPEPQCALERTDENENEFPFLIVVMTILAIAFLFGLCLGSRCGRAIQARAEVMEPEVETEPGTSRCSMWTPTQCSSSSPNGCLRTLCCRSISAALSV